MTVDPSTDFPNRSGVVHPRDGNQRFGDGRRSAMSPAQLPADAPQGSSRHSTFRRRASFAVPVVLVAAVGAGCEHERANTNPSEPSTATDMVVNPPPPSAPPAVPTEQTTTTSVASGAPAPGSTVVANPPPPAPAPVVIANPPPPAPAPPDSVVLTNPPATSTTVMVVANPPPPSTSTTWITSINPPPP